MVGTRRGFQKHMIRFRRAEQMQTLDEWNVELVLLNSHVRDGLLKVGHQVLKVLDGVFDRTDGAVRRVGGLCGVSGYAFEENLRPLHEIVGHVKLKSVNAADLALGTAAAHSRSFSSKRKPSGTLTFRVC